MQRHARTAVALDAVSGHRHMRAAVCAANAAAAVAGKPVVENKGVKAVHEEAESTVAVNHTVAHRDAPVILIVEAVSGEAFDFAVFDARAVFLAAAAIGGMAGQDAVDIFADSAAKNGQTFDCRAECFGHIQQAFISGVAQDKNAAAVGIPVICPRIVAFDGDFGRHFQAAADKSARRDNDSAAGFAGCIQRRLNGLRRIGHAVIYGAECSDIKNTVHVFHSFSLVLLNRSQKPAVMVTVCVSDSPCFPFFSGNAYRAIRKTIHVVRFSQAIMRRCFRSFRFLCPAGLGQPVYST